MEGRRLPDINDIIDITKTLETFGTQYKQALYLQEQYRRNILEVIKEDGWTATIEGIIGTKKHDREIVSGILEEFLGF